MQANPLSFLPFTLYSSPPQAACDFENGFDALTRYRIDGRETPVVLVKWYDFTRWLLERIDSFPKSQRFVFGTRLADHTLDVLETLVEASYSRRKADLLARVNRKIEMLRWLVRLAKDRKVLTEKQYLFACKGLAECGRDGGWLAQAVFGKEGLPMKRHKHLFEQVASLANLLGAARQTLRGKRSRQPGAYHYFTIREPKERLVAAAPFRDRVVHHAIVRVLQPLLERRFIQDSFASRPGKGTHAAMRRAAIFAKQYRYALKMRRTKIFSQHRSRSVADAGRAVDWGPATAGPYLQGGRFAHYNKIEQCWPPGVTCST